MQLSRALRALNVVPAVSFDVVSSNGSDAGLVFWMVKGEMMKRFALVLFLLVIAFCGIGIVDSRAQQTVFVPICSGTNDTAEFQTIINGAASNPRIIKI